MVFWQQDKSNDDKLYKLTQYGRPPTSYICTEKVCVCVSVLYFIIHKFDAFTEFLILKISGIALVALECECQIYSKKIPCQYTQR